MYSPLEQFKIKPLIRIYNHHIDFSISNTTIYIIISIIIIIGLYNLAYNNNMLIKGRWGYLIEGFYKRVEETLKEMLPGQYKRYLPLIISIFIFILINNIIGLVPYSFTTTAQFIITITMSLTIIIGITLLGFFQHKFKFFKLFLPSGLNQGGVRFLIPLIVSIEIISYLIRIVSLSVRLSANIISGHTLIKIISNYGLQYSLSFPVLLILPLGLLSAIFLLEIGVAIIQAYVFTLLTTTYIKDIYYLH